MSQLKRFAPLGVNLDIDPVNLPDNLWSETTNMVPRPGRMERALGYREVFPTPLFDPKFLMYSEQLSVPYWIYAGQNGIGTIDNNGAHTDITPPELTSPVAENSWTGGNLNGIAVLNAVENVPFYWFAGIVGGVALPLPGMRSANTRYRIMRPFKYHLIGLGVTDDNGNFWDAIHWSDGANPGDVPQEWTPLPENEAGDNILADEGGDIVDGLALRDSFYIYKRDSVYEMTYTGGSNVFRFRKVFGTVGALAYNCIVRVKGTHVVLGNGDIYQHDGQNMRSIVDGRIRQTFFDSIDDEHYQNSFALYLEPREEVWFCVPTFGNTRPNMALVWNMTTDTFGYREIPDLDFAAVGVIGAPITTEPWDGDSGSWNSDSTRWQNQSINNTEDSILIADAVKQKLFLANDSTTHDGETYQVTVGKLGMDLDDPQHEKAIRRIWPNVNAPPGTVFTLELFNQRNAVAPLEQVLVADFVPNVDGIPVNINARYLGVRVRSSEAVTWDISGFDIEYMQRGQF